MIELDLHVGDGHIIVNLPRTRLTMTYTRTSSEMPGLAEDPFWTGLDANAPIELDEFREMAWQAATQRAHELGWLRFNPMKKRAVSG